MIKFTAHTCQGTAITTFEITEDDLAITDTTVFYKGHIADLYPEVIPMLFEALQNVYERNVVVDGLKDVCYYIEDDI